MNIQLNSTSRSAETGYAEAPQGAYSLGLVNTKRSSLHSLQEASDQSCFASLYNAVIDGLCWLGSWMGYIFTCGYCCKSVTGEKNLQTDFSKQLDALREELGSREANKGAEETLSWWRQSFEELPEELKERIIQRDMELVAFEMLQKQHEQITDPVELAAAGMYLYTDENNEQPVVVPTQEKLREFVKTNSEKLRPASIQYLSSFVPGDDDDKKIGQYFNTLSGHLRHVSEDLKNGG